MSDLLTVAGLHAGYGAGDILKGIDAAVPRGKVVTVIGPNGSGKSTLIKTLAGLLPARRGDIVLAGERLNELSAPRRIKAGLSYVPQEYNVFRNLTVLENLKIAREFMGSGAARKAATKGNGVLDPEVLALFPELPAKFRTLAGNLSGGQRQMLAFACALTVEPKVLMLDEPSAGLSPKYMADIFATVKKVNARGVSIFMIEQNAAEALRISDTCIVMANGSVRLTSPACDVLAMKDLHSLYLGDAREAMAAP
ncbi:MAG: ABC transporter ATP-binding protein [Casimicrobiaceae bacterium]